jgi:hypothetical protein
MQDRYKREELVSDTKDESNESKQEELEERVKELEEEVENLGERLREHEETAFIGSKTSSGGPGYTSRNESDSCEKDGTDSSGDDWTSSGGPGRNDSEGKDKW